MQCEKPANAPEWYDDDENADVLTCGRKKVVSRRERKVLQYPDGLHCHVKSQLLFGFEKRKLFGVLTCHPLELR